LFIKTKFTDAIVVVNATFVLVSLLIQANKRGSQFHFPSFLLFFCSRFILSKYGCRLRPAAAREHYRILLGRMILHIMASTSPPSKAREPTGRRREPAEFLLREMMQSCEEAMKSLRSDACSAGENLLEDIAGR
jgi:hypothetical protein